MQGYEKHSTSMFHHIQHKQNNLIQNKVIRQNESKVFSPERLEKLKNDVKIKIQNNSNNKPT